MAGERGEEIPADEICPRWPVCDEVAKLESPGTRTRRAALRCPSPKGSARALTSRPALSCGRVPGMVVRGTGSGPFYSLSRGFISATMTAGNGTFRNGGRGMRILRSAALRFRLCGLGIGAIAAVSPASAATKAAAHTARTAGTAGTAGTARPALTATLTRPARHRSSCRSRSGSCPAPRPRRRSASGAKSRRAKRNLPSKRSGSPTMRGTLRATLCSCCLSALAQAGLFGWLLWNLRQGTADLKTAADAAPRDGAIAAHVAAKVADKSMKVSTRALGVCGTPRGNPRAAGRKNRFQGRRRQLRIVAGPRRRDPCRVHGRRTGRRRGQLHSHGPARNQTSPWGWGGRI